MNILPAIKQILIDTGAAQYEVKYNNLSDTPKEQIMIRDTGEVEPDPNDTSAVGLGGIHNKTFQIIVRGTSYQGVQGTAALIREMLHGKNNITKQGIYILNISMFSGFQPITNDIGNYEFSGNFTARARTQ